MPFLQLFWTFVLLIFGHRKSHRLSCYSRLSWLCDFIIPFFFFLLSFGSCASHFHWRPFCKATKKQGRDDFFVECTEHNYPSRFCSSFGQKFVNSILLLLLVLFLFFFGCVCLARAELCRPKTCAWTKYEMQIWFNSHNFLCEILTSAERQFSDPKRVCGGFLSEWNV